MDSFLARPRGNAVYAFIALALAFTWQALTVHYNYGGRWNALYCTGALFVPPPAALSSENIYRLPNVYGYDGQCYHYMAHDPFIRRGFWKSMDSARFRYRRILLPLLVWILAFGQDRYLDFVYYAAVLGCVFAGTWWCAAIARDRGGHPAWSLGFLFVPAVTISLDRLTVDCLLAAIVAGVLLFCGRGQWTRVILLSVAAGLTRESGLLLPAGLAGWALIAERRVRRAIAFGLTTIPTFAWYAYVNAHTPTISSNFISPVPFAGLARRLVTPILGGRNAFISGLACALDYLALAAIIVAMAYCAVYARRLIHTPDGWIAAAFIALVAAVSTSAVWNDPYGYSRGYSPLLLIVGLDGFRSRSIWAGLPIALAAPRIGIQIGTQITRVLAGIFGW